MTRRIGTSQGLKLTNEADERSTEAAGFMTVDPDSNPVFVDQHV